MLSFRGWLPSIAAPLTAISVWCTIASDTDVGADVSVRRRLNLEGRIDNPSLSLACNCHGSNAQSIDGMTDGELPS